MAGPSCTSRATSPLPMRRLLSQSKAAANLEMVFVDKERRSHPNAPLLPEEKSEYRSIIGSLAWLAQQTRHDIAVAVNTLAQRIEKAEVQDLLQANAVVRMVQRSVDRAIVIRRGIFDPKDLALIGFGDASFATSEELKSQAGELLIATKPKDINKVRDGAYDKGVLLSYRTATVKRVVRSTLSSEGYAISETAELLEWTRYVIAELVMEPGTDLSDVQAHAESIQSVVFTDSHGLADTVAKDTSANADRRFKLVVAMLRQTFSSTKLRLQWCNTLQMLADGLTKVLPLQVALCALMASMSYAIPTGGRTGRLGAATLLASRVVRAGGSQLVVRGETLKPNSDTGLEQFMVMLLISYLFVFMCGVVLSWLWFGRPTAARLRDVMVAEDVTEPAPRTRQGSQRSKPTPKTTETTIAVCCEQQHNTRAGRNKSSVYLTCQDCAHHFTWLKNGSPTFMEHRGLRFMKLSWDALQGTTTWDTSQGPVTVADERPTVHAKSTARPRQRAAVRAATSSAAASASAHAEFEEHNSTAESMPGLTDESSEDTHLPPRQQKKETPKNKTAASRIVVTTTVSTAPDDTTKEKPAKAVPKQRAAAAKEQYKKTPWKKQYDGDHDDCWD